MDHLEYLKQIAAKGGQKAASRLTQAQRIERARKGGKAKAANVSKAETTIPK